MDNREENLVAAAVRVAMVDTRNIKHAPEHKGKIPHHLAGRLKLPLWLANLLLFSILILITLIYFLVQTERERQLFYSHTQEHSELLAQVIKLNADNAMAAGEVVKKVAHTFMLNSARFIDYLDTIEPFSSSELSALALESGLSGITIADDQQEVSGPLKWEGEKNEAITKKTLFSHDDQKHLFTLVYPRDEGRGEIRIGLEARQLEVLQKQVGLEQLLITLNNISGISYVRLISSARPPLPTSPARKVPTTGETIIETRLPMNNKILSTGFKPDSLVAREEDLWRDFAMFTLLIGALGGLFSWLLYRYQLSFLTHARRYDKRLAHEREDAILGRAAAAVAHEIRNPLNAIDIGLQRLELEESGLASEYTSLTSAMRNAVGRANSIVGDLRRFAQPLTAQLSTVDITSLVEDIIALYQTKANAANIKIALTANLAPDNKTIQVDSILFGQALENICKNALEAQPAGGFLKINLHVNRSECKITFANAGFKLPPLDVQKITEPWFTTKTRGTGLGLALVERIIKAHHGRFEVECREPEVLLQHIFLPYKRK